MNKILEELDELIYSGKENPIEISFDITKFFQVINKVREELKRLESIDNANPSEALECLHTIAFNTQFIAGMNFGNELRTIEQILIKAQEQEKVLEIIKEKGLDYHSLSAIKQAKDFEEFKELTKNLITKFLDYTQEEYDLLKETLKPQI